MGDLPIRVETGEFMLNVGITGLTGPRELGADESG